MAILAFQTAFGAQQVALLPDDGQASLIVDDAAGLGQDARLPGLVDHLFEVADLKLADVTRIAAVTGPGSFTGLRMGLAFARGLGLALAVPVVGVTTLAAAFPPDTPGRCRVALQAQKRPPEITFWCQDFSDGAPAAAPYERSLEDVIASGITVVSDRPDPLSDAARPLPVFDGQSGPSAVIAAFRGRVLSPADAPPSPVYVRAPDADLPTQRKLQS